MDKLKEKLQQLAEKPKSAFKGEEATKMGLIIPVLQALGWDPFDPDEVVPETVASGGNVDLCLEIGEHEQVFIEAKKAGEKLGGHQDQLLKYCFGRGAYLAVLTNGFEWWFYLPMKKVPWEKRLFLQVDLAAFEAAEQLHPLLSRGEVASGRFLEAAERSFAEKGLQQAWEKLLSDPTDSLISSLSAVARLLLGENPKAVFVRDFLKKQIGQTTETQPQHERDQVDPSKKPQKIPVSDDFSYTGKKPTSFELFNINFPAQTWQDVLLGTVSTALTRAPDRKQELLALAGRKRRYFALSSQEITLEPRQVPGTDIWAECNLSAQDCIRKARQALAALGFDPAELVIHME